LICSGSVLFQEPLFVFIQAAWNAFWAKEQLAVAVALMF
jgi:hypothetical protein